MIRIFTSPEKLDDDIIVNRVSRRANFDDNETESPIIPEKVIINKNNNAKAKEFRGFGAFVVDLACITRGWKMDKWFDMVSYYGVAAYDSNICKNTRPVYTIPSRNIKGFKVIDNLSTTVKKNLKEYDERIISV